MENNIELQSRLPDFFNYKEEIADSGYEAIHDLFLSWTIRCSQKDVKLKDPLVYEYARRIVYSLIFGDENNGKYQTPDFQDDFLVLSVRTLRQYNHIDLLARLEISINGKNQLIVLNIENKWYSTIRPGQLEKSLKAAKVFENGIEPKSLIILPDDLKIQDARLARDRDSEVYRVLQISDLQEFALKYCEKQTKNDLFDEFWYHFY